MNVSWTKSTLAITIAIAIAGGAVAADLSFPDKGTGDFNWDSLKRFERMNFSGQTVVVSGPFLAPEDDLLRSIFSYFEDATGADVQYAGSDSFEQQIIIDTQAGSPPNIAAFPQPGLAEDLASRGLLVPLKNSIRNWTRKNYAAGQSWVDLGSYENKAGKEEFYGFFYKADLKSLVWYSPDNFADYGYEVPESMEDLIALSDQMVSDGNTPWCIGLGSGAATGWPATDWVEDMMLRTQPAEVYDQWVGHEIPFNDDRVVSAIEAFGQFANNNDYVSGGVASVGTTDFRDSPKELFAIPPKCFMHRQASFIPAFFPEDVVVGEDADFFYFPSYASKKLGNPVLGAGVLYAMTKESEAAHALIDYLTTPLAHELWMSNGGFLTPHKGVNSDLYESESQKRQGDILLNATTFRFDGSDLMPGAIGAGAFWTGMVDFVSGSSAREVANEIEKSWQNIE